MATKVTRIATGINNENNVALYNMLLRLKNKGEIAAVVFDLLISSFEGTAFKEISDEEALERVSRLPEDFDSDAVRLWVVERGDLQSFRAMLSLDLELSPDKHSPEDRKAARKTQSVVFFILKNIQLDNPQTNKETVKGTPQDGKNIPANNS